MMNSAAIHELFPHNSDEHGEQDRRLYRPACAGEPPLQQPTATFTNASYYEQQLNASMNVNVAASSVAPIEFKQELIDDLLANVNEPGGSQPVLDTEYVNWLTAEDNLSEYSSSICVANEASSNYQQPAPLAAPSLANSCHYYNQQQQHQHQQQVVGSTSAPQSYAHLSDALLTAAMLPSTAQQFQSPAPSLHYPALLSPALNYYHDWYSHAQYPAPYQDPYGMRNTAAAHLYSPQPYFNQQPTLQLQQQHGQQHGQQQQQQQQQYEQQQQPQQPQQYVQQPLQQQSEQQQQHSIENILEGAQINNSSREARNRAEKNRRDKLNNSIHELAKMVPHVAESPRRVDKTAVLRYAAHALRLHYVFGNTQISACAEILKHSPEKIMEGFFFTVTCTGQILLISPGVEEYLGHCQTELYGQNLLNITHPDDQDFLRHQLLPTNFETLYDLPADADKSAQISKDYINKKLREDLRNFRIRISRAGARTDPAEYALVLIRGCFRLSDGVELNNARLTKPSVANLMRRSKGRDSTLSLQWVGGNDIVLTAFAHILYAVRIWTRQLNTSYEYRTRHLIDGRIVDCDPRISIVTGYLGKEVLNLVPFTFIHRDDSPMVILALKEMYDHKHPYGESTYRLLSLDQNYIYMSTKGHLDIDPVTKEVHSFVSTNTLIDEVEGKRLLAEMHRKYGALVGDMPAPDAEDELLASSNPQRLEEEVINMLNNCLPAAGATPSQTASEDDVVVDDEVPTGSEAPAQERTSPLLLVPPELATTKLSISKTVSFISEKFARPLAGAAAKLGDDNAQAQATTSTAAAAAEEADKPAAQKRRYSQSDIQLASHAKDNQDDDNDANDDDDDLIVDVDDAELLDVITDVKRCRKNTDLEHVLSTSLDDIGRKLDCQLNEVIGLRDQTELYGTTTEGQNVNEIMGEHNKQNEIFANIKDELFEANQCG